MRKGATARIEADPGSLPVPKYSSRMPGPQFPSRGIVNVFDIGLWMEITGPSPLFAGQDRHGGMPTLSQPGMIRRERSPCVTRFGGVTGARHAIGLAATTGPPQHCGWSQAVRGVF